MHFLCALLIGSVTLLKLLSLDKHIDMLQQKQ